MQPHSPLHPLWSLLVIVALACHPNASRSDGTTSPESRGSMEIAGADTALLSLQILPLQSREATMVSLDRSGALTRLEGRNLTIGRAGTAQLNDDDVAALFALAARVPRVQRMGEGIMEGTIYRLGLGGDSIAAFIEPLVPDELRRLLDRLRPHIERAELRANSGWYLAAEPVTASRRTKLASSGSTAIAPTALSPAAREAVLATTAHPLRLHPIPQTVADELTAIGTSREPFVALDEATWIQLAIWAPR